MLNAPKLDLFEGTDTEKPMALDSKKPCLNFFLPSALAFVRMTRLSPIAPLDTGYAAHTPSHGWSVSWMVSVESDVG